MKHTPFLSALGASVYIVVIVSLINSFQVFSDKKDTIAIPMLMLSLFVLSAAIMGFLFVSQPLRLYFDNQKGEAVSFFLKTVGYFACFVLIFFLIFLYTVAR